MLNDAEAENPSILPNRGIFIIRGQRLLLLFRTALHTALYHARDIFCGFGAVVFEPFRNDSHQAVQIERHKVRFLTLRYAVAVEYRRDDIAGKSLIAVLQPQCGRVFDPRAEQALVLLDVAEIRDQIFRRNEIKLVHSAWRSANVAWGGSLQNCGRLQPM